MHSYMNNANILVVVLKTIKYKLGIFSQFGLPVCGSTESDVCILLVLTPVVHFCVLCTYCCS